MPNGSIILVKDNTGKKIAVFLVDEKHADPSSGYSLAIRLLLEKPVEEPTSVVRVASADHPSMYWVNTNNGTLHRLVGTEVEISHRVFGTLPILLLI